MNLASVHFNYQDRQLISRTLTGISIDNDQIALYLLVITSYKQSTRSLEVGNFKTQRQYSLCKQNIIISSGWYKEANIFKFCAWLVAYKLKVKKREQYQDYFYWSDGGNVVQKLVAENHS